MPLRTAACLLAFTLIASSSAHPRSTAPQSAPTDTAQLRARIESSPTLSFTALRITPTSAEPGWHPGSASGVAIDPHGTIYEIARGGTSGPILVLDWEGHVLRSWGTRDFTLPHTIRIDPSGNIWTVDAGSSDVIKYSPGGRKLLTIHVGEGTENGSPFHGTTDIAFGPDGRLYITDGYSNAHVLVYTPGGQHITQWGEPGSGPGQFHLPHSIQIDERGTIYVADRENGRIQKFDPNGHYLGEIPHLGRVYSLRLAGKALWATMQSFDQEPGSAGIWLVKLDRDTGRILGHLDISEARAGHSLDLLPSGDPVITLGNGLLWLRPRHTRPDIRRTSHLRK